MSNKGSLGQQLTEYVERKSGKFDKTPLVCTVDSYDAVTMTCYCIPIAEYADIEQVKICPASGTGHVIFPKVGSVVLVSFLSDNSAFVSMVSEVDAVWLGGDSFGGVVKAGVNAAKLNILENDLNALKASVAAIVAAGAGAPGVPVTQGILAAFFLAPTLYPVVTLTNTTQAMLENTVVKHGTGVT